MRWCALGVFLLLSVLFLMRRREARSRAQARSRIMKHLGSAPKGRGPGRVGRLLESLAGRFDATRYATRLRAALEGSGLRIAWPRFRLMWLWGLLSVPLLAVALTGSALTAPPAAAAAVFLPTVVLELMRRRKDNRASEECEGLAADLALFLRCGIPVEEAIVLCAPDLKPPLSGPVERFQAEIALGSEPDAALEELVDALANPDLELIARAVLVSRETGSDIRAVMDSIGDAIRERAAIRRELYSQTVQGRLSGRIVAGLPFLFLGLTALVSRGTLATLFGTVPGLVMLAAAAVLDLLGFLWIRRILDIKT